MFCEGVSAVSQQYYSSTTCSSNYISVIWSWDTSTFLHSLYMDQPLPTKMYTLNQTLTLLDWWTIDVNYAVLHLVTFVSDIKQD